MKCKNRTRLLKELADASETPIEFIYGIMALQKQTAKDLCSKTNMTKDHFHVIINTLKNGGSIGVKTCAKIAQGLDIDPYILYRLISDYNMKNYLDKLNNGTD